jgi:hypothetical protein
MAPVMTRGTCNGHMVLIWETFFVPLSVSGPNLSFESRVPTDWEMSNLPVVKITSTTWNPADLHRSAPRSNTIHAVDCISTARQDIRSPSTAPQMSIFPTLSDSHCKSSYTRMPFSCTRQQLRGRRVV